MRSKNYRANGLHAHFEFADHLAGSVSYEKIGVKRKVFI
jgi:hypothetical protein